MQDWTHIPLHIRCTERWKIDPTYPEDGCRFWKLTDNAVDRMGEDRMQAPYGGVPATVLAYAATLEGNTLALQNLAGTCGTSVEAISAGIRAYKAGQNIGSKHHPMKYEEMTAKEVALDRWLQKENA